VTRANYTGARYQSGQRGKFVKHNSGPDVTLKEITILHTSDKAIHIELKGGETMWLPLSQLKEIHRTNQKGEDWVVMSGWIAKQKGLA
jgi:hypothetical protein